jgi:hypothetical protein
MKNNKKEPTIEDMINGWLMPYYNITIEEVDKNWVGEKDSMAFYAKYPVTQEQHDEWYKWAIDTLSKHFKWSKKLTRKQFCFDYLNCAPSIKKENNE